jgi:hypothetical protein
MYTNEIAIPAALYDRAIDHNVPVPIDQEIRRKGKGKQYVINRNDNALQSLIKYADTCLVSDPATAAAARNLLLSLRKQGVTFGLQHAADLKVSTAKPVTRRTAAKATGRDYNRELIVTITPRGQLILRPQGRRQAEQVNLSDVYAWAQRNRCLEIARTKAAAKQAKRKARNLSIRKKS